MNQKPGDKMTSVESPGGPGRYLRRLQTAEIELIACKTKCNTLERNYEALLKWKLKMERWLMENFETSLADTDSESDNGAATKMEETTFYAASNTGTHDSSEYAETDNKSASSAGNHSKKQLNDNAIDSAMDGLSEVESGVMKVEPASEDEFNKTINIVEVRSLSGSDVVIKSSSKVIGPNDVEKSANATGSGSQQKDSQGSGTIEVVGTVIEFLDSEYQQRQASQCSNTSSASNVNGTLHSTENENQIGSEHLNDTLGKNHNGNHIGSEHQNETEKKTQEDDKGDNNPSNLSSNEDVSVLTDSIVIKGNSDAGKFNTSQKSEEKGLRSSASLAQNPDTVFKCPQKIHTDDSKGKLSPSRNRARNRTVSQLSSEPGSSSNCMNGNIRTPNSQNGVNLSLSSNQNGSLKRSSKRTLETDRDIEIRTLADDKGKNIRGACTSTLPISLPLKRTTGPTTQTQTLYHVVHKPRDNIDNSEIEDEDDDVSFVSESKVGRGTVEETSAYTGLANIKNHPRRYASTSSSPSNSQTQIVDDVDTTPCAVCYHIYPEPLNEMVFCETCGLCVHQACYGVRPIPEGIWQCNPCKAGMDTKNLACYFCPMPGGALKPVKSPSKRHWAHVSCTLWIPEVSLGSHKTMEPVINVNKIDMERWKLKCTICSIKKGACIQCQYSKRCVRAFHVSCAFKEGLKRLEIDDDAVNKDGIDMKIFCKVHSALTQPETTNKGRKSVAKQRRSMSESPKKKRPKYSSAK